MWSQIDSIDLDDEEKHENESEEDTMSKL